MGSEFKTRRRLRRVEKTCGNCAGKGYYSAKFKDELGENLLFPCEYCGGTGVVYE